MQGRSCILCFETVLGMNKITPIPSPPLPTPSHSPKNKKFPKTFFIFMIFWENFFNGVGVGYPFFESVQNSTYFAGEKLYLMFWNCSWNEQNYPQPLKKFPKNFSKKLFYFMIFLKYLFKGVVLATLSFNRCNMAQGLLRRSWFKYLNIMKKLPLPLPPPPPPFKNSKFFFTIYLEKKLQYLILRSGKFGNLVTSFFRM